MGSLISEADLRAVGALQRLLLAPPLPHALDEWRAAVNAPLRALTGADRAAFILPNDTSVVCYADIPYDADIESYPAYVRRDWGRFDMVRRALDLEVFSRSMLYHPHDREVYRSDYYNEAVVPARAYDSLSMTCRATQRGELVQLVLHHDRPTGRKFGQRELQLMRLLYPPFAAGVAAYYAIERRIAMVGSLLHEGGGGLAVYSAAGQPVHCNAAAARLLHSPAVATAARRLITGLWGTKSAVGRGPRPALVETPTGPVRLRGCILESNVLVAEPVALVLFEPSDSEPHAVSADLLRERFRLTRQQARIAQLLVDRRSNAEIAARLCISVHTVKRHVEQVLARLGVASRLEVRNAIAGLGQDSPAPI